MGHHDLTVGFPKDLESKNFAFVFFRVAARQRREPYAGKGSYNHSPAKNRSAFLNCIACIPLPSLQYFFRGRRERVERTSPKRLEQFKVLNA